MKELIERQIRRVVSAEMAAQTPPPPPAAAAVNVDHVAVKLPEFWTTDPDMWFFQAECAFNRAHITSSRTRFEHVVMKLPEAVIVSVRSLLLAMDPAAADAYEQLKAQLSSSFCKTRWQRGFELLDHPELGDRRPSRMMSEMLALLPPGTEADTLFLCLFLRRLPASMRDHLAAADYKTAAEMAAHADLLWDARTGQPAAAGFGVMPVQYGRSSSPRDSQRSSSPSRDGGRQPRARRDQTPHPTGRRSDGLCASHAKWGSKAWHCTLPCDWEDE